MYNLKNLNDYEYEVLCLDIMEKKLNEKLYRFARGRDGGIDLCDKIEEPKVIIQVKQYSNSKYSNLKSTIIKDEIEKIKKLEPLNYYLCTTVELTRENKKELYDLLRPFIIDELYIMDGIETSDFLEQDENIDIVKKNYKLWINATNVLELINNKNLFIDCDELMYDIENNINKFVETEGYIESINKLNKENIIVIIGGPGVGKSTISKMILLKYASEGYKVRYTTDNNISDIKKIISMDKDCKEIILLDDFLGQHYLNLKETEPNELKSLLSFVRRNRNKKLILNSRITILNEATNRYITFNELMEEYERNTYLINLDNMKKIEKAKILYNHLFFNNIPRDYFESIRENKNYINIVKHKNYNPRIIEYITKESRYRNIKAKDYYRYIMDKLNNPTDVWKDEFENRLSKEDRNMMLILYSLTNSYIEMNNVKEVYDFYIKNLTDIDTSVNIFNRVIHRLSDSLINKIEDGNKIKIGVLNPSINDYIKNEIELNINEQMNIVKNAIYIEQIIKFSNNEQVREWLKNQITSKRLINMKTLEKSISFYYVELVCKYKILEVDIKPIVRLALERSYENIKTQQDINQYYEMLKNVIENEDMIGFYDLKDIFLDKIKMNFILRILDLDSLESLMHQYSYNIYDYAENEKYDEIMEIFKECVLLKIDNTIQTEIESDFNETVYEIVKNSNNDEIEEYLNKREGFLKDKVNKDFLNCLNYKVADILDKFYDYIKISEEELDIQRIEEEFDIDYCIDSNIEYIRNIDDTIEETNNYENEDEEIKNIFERNMYENFKCKDKSV